MSRIMDWDRVSGLLVDWARQGATCGAWKAGQEYSLEWIASNLAGKPGLIVADEVGLGKTRVATAVACAVVAAGGRVAVVIPPGLKSQWEREFTRLHGAMAQWCAAVPVGESRFLRTYDDLFEVDRDDRAIWEQRPALTFISHQFGIPLKLTDTEQRRSRAERWLLPIKVRAQLLDNLYQVKGLRTIDLNRTHRQSEAALWLAEEISRQPELAALIVNAKALKPASGPTVFQWDEEARTVFHRLIGELIGPMDLIIVDEAHKSRAGAQAASAPEDQSRLTACIKQILQPVAHQHVKHLALTATPLELAVDQWQDIFARIGMPDAQIEAMIKIVKHYAETLAETVWFGGMDTAKLEAATEAFQSAYSPWITRRRWCDHEAVQKFRTLGGQQASMAHPHRKWFTCERELGKIPESGRVAVLATEALAQAAKGGETSVVVKSLGLRFAQGLTGLGGPLPDLEDVPVILEGADYASDAAGSARTERLLFWSGVLARTANDALASSQKEEIRLQAHPRVRYAIEVIERAAGVSAEGSLQQPSKVLVFGAYNAPLGALNRALNIRAFLRDYQSGEPTLLPATLQLVDPDFRHWAREFGVDASAQSTRDKIEELRAMYETRRGEQRRGYNDTVRTWVSTRFSSLVASRVRGMEPLLVDWLNVHLAPNSTTGSIEELLDQLFDNDPADEDVQRIPSEGSSGEPDLDQIRAAIAEEMPGGRVQRSAFARFMYRDTSPATRRTLQHRFNQLDANPQILLAQAAVASEGLNLHEACRKVVLFHLDWNPARIEQQIGRVDRQDSLWMKAFNNWMAKSPRSGSPPTIEIYTLALAGTYDDYRRRIVTGRQLTLRSQIFGELVPNQALTSLPHELLEKVAAIAPNFSPVPRQETIATENAKVQERHPVVYSTTTGTAVM